MIDIYENIQPVSFKRAPAQRLLAAREFPSGELPGSMVALSYKKTPACSNPISTSPCASEVTNIFLLRGARSAHGAAIYSSGVYRDVELAVKARIARG